MKKAAIVLVPLLVFLGMPLGTALIITAMSAPAVGQQLQTLECGGVAPATGAWRAPFQQKYTVSDRGFGREFHPIHNEWRMHTGQDMVSLPGPGPVVSIGTGKVAFAGQMGGYGNVVDVQHSEGVVSRYAHLASIDVTRGQSVEAGTKLGVEGTTGTSTGEHLHFEIQIDGRAVDPMPWMTKHGAPLNGKAVAAASQTPEQVPANVEEGGVGFTLPIPGAPRKDSLHNEALPIPANIKKLYIEAGKKYGLAWTLLAGVGMAETAHGRNTAVSSAGAQGHMQFMPSTWQSMGTDGNGDGTADIHNTADSIYSAARYLVHEGATRGGGEGVKEALFAYNRATWYGNDVLYYAEAYGGGIVLGTTTDCTETSGTSSRNLPPLTDARAKKVLTWAAEQDGDDYVMGGEGPDAWDCSSLTQRAFSQIDVSMPRTAAAQRDWLAAGNGIRIKPGEEKPGDLVFWDSYLGPNVIGHVAMVWDPATKSTIEAQSTNTGVGHFSYEGKEDKQIFEIWRVGNVSDNPSRST
ncbi:peptidoglycan DD-metalloendopeptidase family protein [Janibacter alittae]|uniref:Peptidoglycan DD-metalloendopeptidase family protein n=1 Tax=Janibacter alittae TaxID=3115209 RepID=A0ABZ2MLB5_9MICO